jgi:hypothetical protein
MLQIYENIIFSVVLSEFHIKERIWRKLNGEFHNLLSSPNSGDQMKNNDMGNVQHWGGGGVREWDKIFLGGLSRVETVL